jgi:hypothetical protein
MNNLARRTGIFVLESSLKLFDERMIYSASNAIYFMASRFSAISSR